MDDVAVRIFDLVDQKFDEQREFALAIEINPKTVSAWRTGRAKSYRHHLVVIADVLGTSTEYLLTGEGPKKKTAAPIGTTAVTEDDIKAAFFNGADPNLTKEEQDALWEDAKAFMQFKIQQRKNQENK